MAISHRGVPDRLLWEATAPVVTVEVGEARIRTFGQPKGAYAIEDEALASYPIREVGRIEPDGLSAVVPLRLDGADAPACSIRYEAFFGFGQQLTDFDQKGNFLSIVVQEHGVGRGRRLVTEDAGPARAAGGLPAPGRFRLGGDPVTASGRRAAGRAGRYPVNRGLRRLGFRLTTIFDTSPPSPPMLPF